MKHRVLAWDGCLNVRDLGGMPLEGGGETRFGAVVRADSIRGLSDDGWRALVDYGVRTAVDLRGEEEWAADPPRELPIALVRFPMDPREAPPAHDWPSMREAYLGLLERFRRGFAGTIATVARSDATVVVHCAGGRDRTGLACALLLRLAGAEPEEIAADHAFSDEAFAPTLRTWVAAPAEEEERERRRRIAAPAGRTMLEVLEAVEGRYGGVGDYLLTGGATTAELDRAARRLQP